MGRLWPVAPAHSHNQPDDGAPSLEPGIRQRPGDDVGQQRIGGDNHVGPRRQLGEQEARPNEEELSEVIPLRICQSGESRHRRPGVTVERRRDSPHASPSFSQLRLLRQCVLMQTIGRVGHDRVDRAVFSSIQPVETVAVEQRRGAEFERVLSIPRLRSGIVAGRRLVPYSGDRRLAAL